MGVSTSSSSPRRTPRAVNKYLDRQGVVDHVAAVVLVVLVRLDVPVRIFGPGQEGVLPRLLRRQPIKLPTSPRMPLNGVDEFCLGPSLPPVRAHRDPRDLGLARPRSAGNRVDLVRGKRLVHTWSRDRKSTRLNSSHSSISYAVFCLKKKTQSTSPRDRTSRFTTFPC